MKYQIFWYIFSIEDRSLMSLMKLSRGEKKRETLRDCRKEGYAGGRQGEGVRGRGPTGQQVGKRWSIFLIDCIRFDWIGLVGIWDWKAFLRFTGNCILSFKMSVQWCTILLFLLPSPFLFIHIFFFVMLVATVGQQQSSVFFLLITLFFSSLFEWGFSQRPRKKAIFSYIYFIQLNAISIYIWPFIRSCIFFQYFLFFT